MRNGNGNFSTFALSGVSIKEWFTCWFGDL